MSIDCRPMSRRQLDTSFILTGMEHPITVEVDGKNYTGLYTVSAGVVTVESDWGELRGHVGATPERIAHRLFLEILRAQSLAASLMMNQEISLDLIKVLFFLDEDTFLTLFSILNWLSSSGSSRAYYAPWPVGKSHKLATQRCASRVDRIRQIVPFLP